MFQLDRLRVVNETLKQITGEIFDNRVELSDDMHNVAREVEERAIRLRAMLKEEQKRKEERDNEDSKRR